MKRTHRTIKTICLLLALALLSAWLLSCAEPVAQNGDAEKTSPGAAAGTETDAGDAADEQGSDPKPVALDTTGINASDFYVNQRIFATNLLRGVQAQQPGENVLLSPLSVMLALTLTATGAKGETRAQMEQLLGTSDAEALLQRLSDHVRKLPSDDCARTTVADSLWLRDDDGLVTSEDFLWRATNMYGAEVYVEPFNDATAQKINAWTDKATDGMIREVVKEIDPQAMLYLINALLFDAQWQDVYRESALVPGTFTAADGEKQEVTMMKSTERIYLRDEYAQGVRRYYQSGGYSLVALLPDQGVRMEDYLASLTGERLTALLESSGAPIVHTTLPKFSIRAEYELSDVLASLGMTDVFDSQAADLGDLATLNGESVYISSIRQSTAIEVNEVGTRAAAVTVEHAAGASRPEGVYYLNFDRPFVFMILDRNKVPLFVGVVNSIS